MAKPAVTLCVTCSAEVQQKPVGRPRLRCDVCIAEYHYLSKTGPTGRQCLTPTCDVVMPRRARFSYCAKCRRKRARGEHLPPALVDATQPVTTP